MFKRGMSTIIVTIIMITLVLAAVGVVWVIVQNILEEGADDISLGALKINLDIEKVKITDAGVEVKVKRNAGKADLIGINFIISDGVDTQVFEETTTMGELATKTFTLSYTGFVKSVEIAPVLRSESGKEKIVNVVEKEVPTFGLEFSPGFSCNQILKDGDSKGDGVYWIKPLGEKIQVYCYMTTLNLIMDSLINSDSWVVGQGSVSGYSQNGGNSENIREMGIGPQGDIVILWKAVPDSSSGPDGGWNGAVIPIDHTKTYRLTVWIKKTGSAGGTTYFGTQGWQVTHLNGVAQGNPYFFCGDLPELDKWYLLVGYIHGSGDNSVTKYGGIYDGKSGKKVWSVTGDGNCNSDYKLKTSSTTLVHRTYLYYDTTTTDRQYFWNPTFTEVSGYNLPLETG